MRYVVAGLEQDAAEPEVELVWEQRSDGVHLRGRSTVTPARGWVTILVLTNDGRLQRWNYECGLQMLGFKTDHGKIALYPVPGRTR